MWNLVGDGGRGLVWPSGVSAISSFFHDFLPETTPSANTLCGKTRRGFINRLQTTWGTSGVRVQAQQKRERGKCSSIKQRMLERIFHRCQAKVGSHPFSCLPRPLTSPPTRPVLSLVLKDPPCPCKGGGYTPQVFRIKELEGTSEVL